MSLDVTLIGKETPEECICSECGQTHIKTYREVFYDANITHNLNSMAEEAGIYKHLWRPDEIGISKAEQLIEPLKEALTLMKASPSRFEKHNPENGWGNFGIFFRFTKNYLAACEEHPEATVEASR